MVYYGPVNHISFNVLQMNKERTLGLWILQVESNEY